MDGGENSLPSIALFSVAMHPEEAASGRFCRCIV